MPREITFDCCTHCHRHGRFLIIAHGRLVDVSPEFASVKGASVALNQMRKQPKRLRFTVREETNALTRVAVTGFPGYEEHFPEDLRRLLDTWNVLLMSCMHNRNEYNKLISSLPCHLHNKVAEVERLVSTSALS